MPLQSGFINPQGGLIVNTTGTIGWSGFANIYTSNDTREAFTIPLGSGQRATHYIVATGFPFNIPPMHSIVGIEFRVERSIASSFVTIKDHAIRIFREGVVQGVNQASGVSWDTSDSYQIYGGSGHLLDESTRHLWGLTWTRDQINSTSWGLAVSASGLLSGGISTGGQIDHIEARVSYEPTFASSGNTTFFVHGFDIASGSPPLFIAGGVPVESGHTLYIYGLDVSSGSPTLFTHGFDNYSGNFNLFIAGGVPVNSGLTLFMDTYAVTGIPGGAMNLVLKGPSVQTASSPISGVSLYTFGTSLSGSFAINKNLGLMIKATNHPSYMNLYILGPTSAPVTGRTNLSLTGAAFTVAGNIALYLANSGVLTNVPLFIEGKQITIGGDPSHPSTGSIPVEAGMNIFLRRNPAEMINLFIQNQTVSGDLSMFVQGANLLSSGINLVISSAVASSILSTNLYTFGF